MKGNRKTDMNKTTWANALNKPVGGDILKFIGWEEYVVNLKRPYPGSVKPKKQKS